ncbi:MAG: hypothetical protein FWE19_07250 [Oscillospiraceae bacterium]|nr:hypothetical protein [Oscillospiraceae bacterium]
MTATDFGVKAKKKHDKIYYSLEFTVCKSMGVSEVYSFDSHDEKLLKTLLDQIMAKGEFLFDTDCKACDRTIRCTELDYDKYVEMTESGELKGELKFAGGDYVITV